MGANTHRTIKWSVILLIIVGAFIASANSEQGGKARTVERTVGRTFFAVHADGVLVIGLALYSTSIAIIIVIIPIRYNWGENEEN